MTTAKHALKIIINKKIWYRLN